MYVDAVTTAAVADGMDRRIVGGRVQAVIQTGRDSMGFEIYAHQERHYLLMTIDPDSARCHLVPDRLRRGVEQPSPLGLLLRKYLDGARLMAATQPPWERILWLDFSGHEGECRLIVETMDRRSNIILAVEGEILDCLRRVGPSQNRYRVLLPGKPYVPPPPQRKTPPEQITPSLIDGFLGQSPDIPAWRALVNNIAGVSPLFAREVIHRACDEAEAPAFDVAGEIVYSAFATLIAAVQDKAWSPCVVPAESGEGYRAFAAYEITCLEGCQPVESISAAMAAYFGAPVGIEAYDAGKSNVKAQLDDALERMGRKLAALERQSSGEEELETLRKQAELLLAYAPTLEPGQAVFRAQYDPEGPTLTIELDPTLSPLENAQRYFDRYEKAKRAAKDVPRLQRAARRELAYLKQLSTDLALAENWPEIDMVREALQEAGFWQGPRTRGPRGGKPGIRRFTTGDGFVILVGRNAAQNHALITERSKGDDLWLHARGIPGSHVIVKNDGRPIPDEVIRRAAELAAYYSAGRDDTSVEVDVTQRRYVRTIRGGKPGMVIYRNEQTLTVQPRRDQASSPA
jgi:predicted ribosome quality control (RQC) complex YloA/Tae2 family protein